MSGEDALSGLDEFCVAHEDRLSFPLSAAFSIPVDLSSTHRHHFNPFVTHH